MTFKNTNFTHKKSNKTLHRMPYVWEKKQKTKNKKQKPKNFKSYTFEENERSTNDLNLSFLLILLKWTNASGVSAVVSLTDLLDSYTCHTP